MNKIAVIGDSHVNFFGGHEFRVNHPIVNTFGVIEDGGYRKLISHHVGVNNTGDLIPNFQTFHLGPALAYHLNKYHTRTRAREKIDVLLQSGLIQPGQKVLCAFGEIDIRVHVFLEAEKRGG